MLKGKVVLVPFPFDDLAASKVRPAVCLTDRIGPHEHVIVAFITSKAPEPVLPSDIHLPCSGDGCECMGLKVDSALRLHRVITLSVTLIRRELGTIPPKIQTSIDTKLRDLFQL